MKTFLRFAAPFLFLFALCAAPAYADEATYPIELNEVTFPDASWRAYVDQTYAGGDGELTENEADAVAALYLSGTGLEAKSLAGIEYFPSLSYLDCDGLGLAQDTLDLRQNHKLEHLDCRNNPGLDALNITGLADLAYLSFSDTGIESIDLSTNHALDTIECIDAPITALDVSANTELVSLYCNSSAIETLTMTGNDALEWLECSSTPISSLDTSHLAMLKTLYCNDTDIETLDVSSNTQLAYLDCSSTNITSLNTSANRHLQYLYCGQTSISALDLSANEFLRSLHCSGTLLTTLSLAGNPNLQELDASKCRIFNLDLSRAGENRLYIRDLSNQRVEVALEPTAPNRYCSVETYDLDNPVFDKPGISYDPDSGHLLLDRFYSDAPFTTDTGYSWQSEMQQVSGTVVFTLPKCSVSFYDWDESLIDKQMVPRGSAAACPPTPQRTGYIFEKWDKSTDYVLEDMDVHAIYDKEDTPAPPVTGDPDPKPQPDPQPDPQPPPTPQPDPQPDPDPQPLPPAQDAPHSTDTQASTSGSGNVDTTTSIGSLAHTGDTVKGVTALCLLGGIAGIALGIILLLRRRED